MANDGDYSDDEFDDGNITGQDMIDALDHTERSFTIPLLESPVRSSWRGNNQQPRNRNSSALSLESDMTDPSVVAALRDVETQVIGERAQDTAQNELVTITRAELELIKRNAFNAGQKHSQTPPPPFPFLKLPTELRLIFYGHYFPDRNPLTSCSQVSAIPSRVERTMPCCCSDTWCGTTRPWISTNLTLTCKQIYHETRDDFLYKERRFKATVGRFDKRIQEIRPHLRFWQYMQHLELVIDWSLNYSAPYEAGNLIVHLVALLRGGQNLRSFKLRYTATSRQESIMRFKDLNVRGNVQITQIFDDFTEPHESEEKARKNRLERLLFGMLGCASYDAPPYDFIVSTRMLDEPLIRMDPDTPISEMYITISTSTD